jgi:hypothetical protein
MISIHAKSYLSNDPALVVLYKQIREKSLQTIKGATQLPPTAEWNFVLRNARLYDRMGCDLLALDLVSHWEFLRAELPSANKQIPARLGVEAVDYRKFLRRRSSLVVADLPLSPNLSTNDVRSPTITQAKVKKPPPTTFQEPNANSLLDSFGF